MSEEWRKCSSCKASIGFKQKYFICSVSTCNGQRTGYVFCTVHCFERHLPGARHKDAAAVETISPGAGAASILGGTPAIANEPKPAGNRMMATNTGGGRPAAPRAPQEVLVIASRLKEYITARSEYNTSASVMEVLSDHLRVICDRGIDNARAEGRRTVMDRDFAFLKT